MGFRLIISLLLLSVVCKVYSLDKPIRKVIELSSSQKRELIEATASLLNSDPSTRLKKALELQQVDKLLVETWDNEPGFQGWINFASIRLTAKRSFQSRILCVKEGHDLPWSHCQDESYVVAELSIGNIIVDDEISNEKLQAILDFVQDSKLMSPDGTLILAEKIYQVVEYKLSKNLGVFSTASDGKHTGIYLRSVTIDGRETYEPSNSTCK